MDPRIEKLKNVITNPPFNMEWRYDGELDKGYRITLATRRIPSWTDRDEFLNLTYNGTRDIFNISYPRLQFSKPSYIKEFIENGKYGQIFKIDYYNIVSRKFLDNITETFSICESYFGVLDFYMNTDGDILQKIIKTVDEYRGGFLLHRSEEKELSEIKMKYLNNSDLNIDDWTNSM